MPTKYVVIAESVAHVTSISMNSVVSSWLMGSAIAYCFATPIYSLLKRLLSKTEDEVIGHQVPLGILSIGIAHGIVAIITHYIY